jgi:hypothetical protein
MEADNNGDTPTITFRQIQRSQGALMALLKAKPSGMLSVINRDGKEQFRVMNTEIADTLLRKLKGETQSMATLSSEDREMFQNIQGQLEELTSLVKSALNY